MPASFNSDEDDCFFFESEHLALRGNKDYCEVLKTLVILSAQREKMIKDYIKVVEIRKKVLENPDVIKKIIKGEELGIELPPMIELPKIPVINFEKYNAKLLQTELSNIYSDTNLSKEDEWKKEQEHDKNDSHQAWTTEEQKKLEELLLKYPPEPIERRRFQKIANELGSRSVSQVASRIQKYFLKLYRAGLPIPGRIPKSFERNKKSFMHKHQRHNHYLWKPTTFFPELNPPVTMNDLGGNTPGPSINQHFSSSPANYLIESGYQQATEITGKSKGELQLEILKRVREEKLRTQGNCSGDFQHIGYKCNYCNSEPILGSRWHCAVCTESIDFCTDCMVSQMYTSNNHPLTHPMVILQDDEQHSVSDGITFYSKSTSVKDEEEDSSDSYGFEDMEKEEEECLDSDEESSSNFDGNMN